MSLKIIITNINFGYEDDEINRVEVHYEFKDDNYVDSIRGYLAIDYADYTANEGLNSLKALVKQNLIDRISNSI